jgi:single-strand DNA-binding protein
MASLNKVFLIGNLTRDPEVRYTPSGAAVGDLGLAVSRKFKSGDGENKEETCFVNITVWGRQAETCAEYLKKGRPVMVEGRLRYEDWEKDGKKYNKIVVVAERVQFLGSRDQAGSGGGGGGGSSSGGGGGSSSGGGGAPAVETGGAPMGDDENLPF